MKDIIPVEWRTLKKGSLFRGKIKYIDQRLLPGKLRFIETDDLMDICEAIKTLAIRGAPLIGITAAMAVAAYIQNDSSSVEKLIEKIKKACKILRQTRPTAVNLHASLKRIERKALYSKKSSPEEFKNTIIQEALKIYEENKIMCMKIGKYGASVLKNANTFLVHCNAGKLATGGIGTALAPLYIMHWEGKKIKVFVTETRPLLQGARLTAWELHHEGIELSLLCDSAAGFLMKNSRIDAVLIGADRIALNGDVANKIGSYSLAILAREHNIPFYVFAPTTTIDFNAKNGLDIPIEHRKNEEVLYLEGKLLSIKNIDVYNPSFDIIPSCLITAIITEKGILKPDYQKIIPKFKNQPFQ